MMKNEGLLRAILGNTVFDKFKSFFDSCCGGGISTCCPSEKYTISKSINGCVFNSPKYDIFATSNTALDGALGYVVYASLDGAAYTIKGNSFLVSGISSNTLTLIENISFQAGHTWEIYIVDSRGNWSNSVTFTTVSC